MVTAAGATSEALWTSLSPLIVHSVNPENPDSAFLVEEALQLWLAVVRGHVSGLSLALAACLLAFVGAVVTNRRRCWNFAIEVIAFVCSRGMRVSPVALSLAKLVYCALCVPSSTGEGGPKIRRQLGWTRRPPLAVPGPRNGVHAGCV